MTPTTTDGGPLAQDFAAATYRSDPERRGYLFGLGPVREPTEEEAAEAARARQEPEMAALVALSEKARAGEDVARLPITAVPDKAAAAQAVVVPEPPAPAAEVPEEWWAEPKAEPGEVPLYRFEPEAADGTRVMPVTDQHTESLPQVTT